MLTRELGNMKRILIAVDGSDASISAAESAHRLFGDDAQYVVMNVSKAGPILWDDTSLAYGALYPVGFPGAGLIAAVPLGAGDAEATGGTGSRVGDAEDLAETVAVQAGVPSPEIVGDTGDVADAIIAAADEHDVDVVVVGVHERGWLERLFTRSVSSTVLRRAEVPVLVVR